MKNYLKRVSYNMSVTLIKSKRVDEELERRQKSIIYRMKVFFNKERIEIERKFLFLLVYLYSLTTFNVDSRVAYGFVAEMDDVLTPISRYFKKMDVLVNKWGFKQDHISILLSKLVPHDLLKGFLHRLAYNLSIGASFSEFIKLEYHKYILDFDYSFERALDKLRILSDVYTALLDAAIIVSMTAVLVSILFGASNTYVILMLITVITLSALFSSITLIKVNLPPDIMVPHSLPHRSNRLKRLDKIVRKLIYFISIASFVPILMIYSVIDASIFIDKILEYSLLISSVYFLLGGIALFVGKLGLNIIRTIEEYDALYPVFINTLGEAAMMTGSLKEGLTRIIYNDYSKLNNLIRRLYNRLVVGVDPEVAWRLFSEESGSNLIFFLTSIFFNAVRRGASIRETSRILYDTSLRISKRRVGRNQIYNYFRGMVIPLQATFVAVLSLIVVLIGLLGKFMVIIQGFITYMEMPDMKILLSFIFFLIGILSIGNSWSIYMLKGDSIYTMIYYLGLSLLISGAVFLIMAGGSGTVLRFFTEFERGVEGVFTT